ncbi:MAG: DEAD/DEAH box helicase family protein [Elusimicrobia bacterium]|jgi:type I restriction enzyme R subunit|nr:DEAD/DEAH box helicase family protein [Elusimicrobiota bacterium]
MQKEAKARIKINNLLRNAGWRFFDNNTGSANIQLEPKVKLKEKDIDVFGNDFEKTTNGYIDFLLLDERKYPFIVLEAKAEDKDPLSGKEQARRYAQSLDIKLIILSNGNLHYFWNLEHGNPQIITKFPTPESANHFKYYKPDTQKLAEKEIQKDYIALTQYPGYMNDPRWSDETERDIFIKEKNLMFLRPYQLRAIKALQVAAKHEKERYLFEMATGTGKTLVSAAVIKLFLKTGNAKRILFLVDRLELETQAYKNFVKYLKNDFTTVIYKEHNDDWNKAEIVVSTVQSLSSNNKYQKLFSPTDFDLIISDEAHRSISGNSRAVFEYFIGYKLGLTATPKDYLKNIEDISELDPRKWERRQLRDTYKTFGCEKSEPTFRYSLINGVKEKYLINPVVADARTEISTQLLSDKGYSIMVATDEGEDTEKTFFQKDFEKKFFSEKTNKIFCKTFLENALKDPVSGEVGKSIVFCVSQNHASKVTQILNEFADELFPDKYNSDFAVQVTSIIPNVQQFSINFANNTLNGYTRMLPNYKSSKTRVCVTVGMMTTGYDCQDILNICLMRSIFSPTDFVQIKGRGTRKYEFKYTKQEGAYKEQIKIQKNKFKLFDFFANVEYFEEKYNYDEVIEMPPLSKGNGPGDQAPTVEDVSVYIPDPLKTFNEEAVGLQGMRIDRELFDKFKEQIKQDGFINEKYEKGDMQAVEDYVNEEVFDKPEDYFNLNKLRKSVKADRRITLREFIDYVFGNISRFKLKDEMLDEEVDKFISIYKPENKYVLLIKNYLKSYVTDSAIREIVRNKQYAKFAHNPKISLEEFKALNGWRDVVPEYVKDYISINAYI